MGRVTYESLPAAVRPLPGRHNIVITRNPQWTPQSSTVTVVASVEEALHRPGDIWVIGGGQIYQEALPWADQVVATEVIGEWQGDAHFPSLPHEEWQRVELCHNDSEGWVQFSYRRRLSCDWSCSCQADDRRP